MGHTHVACTRRTARSRRGACARLRGACTKPPWTLPRWRRAERHRIAVRTRSDSSCCTCAMPWTNAPYERITRADSCKLIASSTTCVCAVCAARKAAERPSSSRGGRGQTPGQRQTPRVAGEIRAAAPRPAAPGLAALRHALARLVGADRVYHLCARTAHDRQG